MYRSSFSLPSDFDGRCIPLTEIGDDAPRFAVQILHGMAEHRKRYIPFMEYIAEQGGVLIIHDHRGHGENADDPALAGYFGPDGADAAMADVHTAGEYLRKKYPALPFILMGHSMGSLMARLYAAEHDDRLDGLLLTGEASRNSAVGAGLLLTRLIALFRGDRYRSPMIHNLAMGGYDRAFAESAGTDPLGGQLMWLSADVENRRAYIEDPLCGQPFPLNGFDALFTFMRRAYAPKYWNVHRKNLPILFLSGEEDPVMTDRKHFEDAMRFLRDMGYKNVSGKLYPGMRHEILMEADRMTVYRDAAAFFAGITQIDPYEPFTHGPEENAEKISSGT